MVKKQILWRILREPLVHFLVIGFLLFTILSSINTRNSDKRSNRIAVDGDSLLAYLQFRSNMFSPEVFQSKLDGLSSKELKRLIDDFVREEALFRRATALGLDQNDFGARQRLIGKLEFINQGLISSSISLSEDDLWEYLKRNQERYLEPETITFTHVFFNAGQQGQEAAEAKARATLLELNGASPIPFHEAPAFGDRFLYHQNYVEKEADEIKSHFGSEMQEQLFLLEPNDGTWRGPFRSAYGSHLVLLTRKTEMHLPEFENLKRRLEQDAYQAWLKEELQQIERSVVESYQVELDRALRERLEKGDTK